MKQNITFFWVRRDFRLVDNPALTAAIAFSQKNNIPFLPVFILDEDILSGNTHPHIGYPRRLFLSRVLAHFAKQFERFEIFLGNPDEIFTILQREFDVHVYTNDDIEPYSRHRDTNVSKIVHSFHLFNDQLTIDRNTVSGTGNQYSVFTPFKNAVWDQFISAMPLPSPDLNSVEYFKQEISKISYISTTSSEKTLQLKIFSHIDTAWKFTIEQKEYNLDTLLTRPNYDQWFHVEQDVLKSFKTYIKSGKLEAYKSLRDNLSLDTQQNGQTSKMSVALKWGLVSSRTLKQLILDTFGVDSVTISSLQFNENISTYISELIWREFYKYILYHRPDMLNLEYQKKFQNTIQWESNIESHKRFVSWIKGETGYPIVDAAMQQIAQTGWMHNRSRMIVASILTKNLGVDWRWGQEYFRATLLDLDEASNNGGWQWGASTGADSKPIRIFNPYLQAENYDKEKLYMAKWLPKTYVESPLLDYKMSRVQAMNRYILAKKN